jgi:hypothetical protein
VTKGKSEFGTTDNDDSLSDKMVGIFNDEMIKWYVGKQLRKNHCKKGEYPQSYSIEIQHISDFIRGIIFPYKNIWLF